MMLSGAGSQDKPQPTTPGQSKPWDGLRWEYKHVLIQQPFSAYLNSHGEEGWELVAAYPSPEAKKDGLYCLFKRPKPFESDDKR
jgi:hypothetical protein